VSLLPIYYIEYTKLLNTKHYRTLQKFVIKLLDNGTAYRSISRMESQ